MRFFAASYHLGTKLEQHVWLLWGNTDNEYKYRSKSNGLSQAQIILFPTKYMKFYQNMKRVKKTDLFIIHGAFSHKIWVALALRPSIWDRTVWVMWGGDTPRNYGKKLQGFSPLEIARHARRQMYLLLRKWLALKVGVVASLTPGDFDKLKPSRGKRNNYMRVFYSDHELSVYKDRKPRSSSTLRVLLGNSGAASNRHAEALHWLKRFAEEDIKVFCPLNYGPVEHRERIRDLGRELIGSKFCPLLKLMEREDYRNLLKSLDVLVFNHLRQQGLFNLYAMLFAGKKCYLRSESSTFCMLSDLGIKVFPTEDLASISFAEFAQPLSGEELRNNLERCEKHLSRDAAIESWRKLFDRMSQAK